MNDLPQARGTAPSWSPCRRQSPRVTGDRRTKRGKSPLASLSGPRTTGDHTPHARRGVITESLAAAMARGRRPVPFRTWKLRPGTAMVLHPAGCGRVARRRTNTYTGGPGDRQHANPRTPLPYPHKNTNNTEKRATAQAHPHTQAHTQGHASHTHGPRTHTPAHHTHLLCVRGTLC